MSRRTFVVGGLCSLLAASAGCEKPRQHVQAATVSLGRPEALRPGINAFLMIRLFVVRSADRIQALSAVCSHQACLIVPSTDGSQGFFCPCHGSHFDEAGRVLTPPAEKPLSAYRISKESDGLLYAHLGEEVPVEWRFQL